jgi:hypothetical protein
VIITIIPSTYLAYQTVKHSFFERNAVSFISQELNFDNTKVISRDLRYDSKNPVIEVTLFGEPVSEDMIDQARKQLASYNLEECQLIVLQGYDEGVNETSLANSIRSGVIEELYRQNEQTLRSKDERIKLLESELTRIKRVSNFTQELSPELKALYPTLTNFSVNQSFLMRLDSLQQDTVYLAYAKFARRPTRTEIKKLDGWLKARVKSDNVQLVIE